MDFFHWATTENKWIFFHMLAGGVSYVGLRALKVSSELSLLAVLLGALSWECVEFATDDVLTIYGSLARWFADSTGDVLGSLAVAGLCALTEVVVQQRGEK